MNVKTISKNIFFKYKIFENTKSIEALYLLEMIPLLIPKNKLTIGSPTTPYLGPLTFHRTSGTLKVCWYILIFTNNNIKTLFEVPVLIITLQLIL